MASQAALRRALKLNPRPLQKTVVPLGGTLPNGFDRIFHVRPDFKPTFYHIDAEGHVLGRLASQIVRILMGKHRPNYQPSIDKGDCVVITNCEKIVLTAGQWKYKVYRWHTGYPGGLKVHIS